MLFVTNVECRCIMHAFVNVGGRTKENMFYKTEEREWEFYTFFIMFCQTERVCSIFRFMDSEGEHFCFLLFLYKISFIFSFVRLYIYFHVFTFFVLSLLLDFLLRVNKQWTRGVARFILFVPKINFSSLFCLLLICTFPKNGASTIKRMPTEFSCPFVWIVCW